AVQRLRNLRLQLEHREYAEPRLDPTVERTQLQVLHHHELPDGAVAHVLHGHVVDGLKGEPMETIRRSRATIALRVGVLAALTLVGAVIAYRHIADASSQGPIPAAKRDREAKD